MNFEAVKAWYTESVHRRIRNGRIAGVFGIILMPLALAVAAGLIFALLHGFGHRREEPMSVATCVWISVAILPLMFVANRFTPRRNLIEEHISEGGSGFSRRGAVYLQVLMWILLAGPRLLDWAIYSFRESKRLQQQDAHSCAAVLWLLLTNYKKVPYDTIQTNLPWLDMDATIPQVLAIPGVVGLNTPPAGMSLTQDMRDGMRAGKHE